MHDNEEINRICGYTTGYTTGYKTTDKTSIATTCAATNRLDEICCRSNVSTVNAIDMSGCCGTYIDGTYIPSLKVSPLSTNDLVVTTDTINSPDLYITTSDGDNKTFAEAIAEINWKGKVVKVESSNHYWSCLKYREVKPNHIIRV